MYICEIYTKLVFSYLNSKTRRARRIHEWERNANIKLIPNAAKRKINPNLSLPTFKLDCILLPEQGYIRNNYDKQTIAHHLAASIFQLLYLQF